MELANIFFGMLAPDCPGFSDSPGFWRSGNNAVMGMAEGLGGEAYAFRPIQAWPRYPRLFLPEYEVRVGNRTIRGFATVNVLGLREFVRGWQAFWASIKWALRNRDKDRVIFSYNLTTPPIGALIFAAKLTGSRIVPILFDLGLAPGGEERGVRGWLYRRSVWHARKVLRRCDGVVTITKGLQNKYCGSRPTLLMRGGVDAAATRGMDVRDRQVVTFLSLGMLYEYNGIRTILEAMGKCTDPRVRLVIAGRGPLENLVRKAALDDPRIVFASMLDAKGVEDAYGRADCVIVYRPTRTMDTSNWFPSKIVEALGRGRLLLTTNVDGVREEIGAFCRILEDESAEALALEMDTIAKMPREERDAIASRALEYAKKNLSWTTQMQKVLTWVQGIPK